MPEQAAGSSVASAAGASANTDMSSVTMNTGTSTGRGRGRGFRRGGRGGRSSGSRSTNTQQSRTSGSTFSRLRFTGREDALKNHVYDMADPSGSANGFRTTTKEIAEFAGRTYKMGNHVKRAIELMKPSALTKPVKPVGVSVPHQSSKMSMRKNTNRRSSRLWLRRRFSKAARKWRTH
jgi:hypothetical protein